MMRVDIATLFPEMCQRVLDESILFELVDRIEVGEARKVNGQRICDVKVVYRYVGSVDDALAQERLEAYEKAI